MRRNMKQKCMVQILIILVITTAASVLAEEVKISLTNSEKTQFELRLKTCDALYEKYGETGSNLQETLGNYEVTQCKYEVVSDFYKKVFSPSKAAFEGQNLNHLLESSAKYFCRYSNEESNKNSFCNCRVWESKADLTQCVTSAGMDSVKFSGEMLGIMESAALIINYHD